MSQLLLMPDKRGHLPGLLRDLVRSGWEIESIPADGKIPRNGMKLILSAYDRELKMRVFAYKVTSSGRDRPHERRVEITTTYKSGLKRLKDFTDVVLGVDVLTEKYVGIDSKRLQLGGPTHNASSFFDLEGLSVTRGNMLINPRPAANSIFPDRTEHHSFFDRSRLAEYLFNQSEIHSGLYAYGGKFNGKSPTTQRRLPIAFDSDKASGDVFVLTSNARPSRQPIPQSFIEAAEANDFSKFKKTKITPEQLKKLLNICEEIGNLGEQLVLAAERKRLTKLGFDKQAGKVERVSLSSVGEGYDISSFEDDGITPRYLEVKASIGTGAIVDVSRGEWLAAQKMRDRYYLVRVTAVRNSPRIHFVRDPVRLEQDGLVVRTPTGWKVNLRSALGS